MIPTKTPGSLFNDLTGNDASLNVRWLVANDPVFFEVLNRPLTDIVVRQLVIAKALDTLQVRLGHQTLFPFLVQPLVASGTEQVDVPIGWIWDFHASLPKKWENLRLAKIKRMAGTNGDTDGYTGVLRLIFTASTISSSTEVAIFQVDYEIDSNLTFQPARLTVVESPEESTVISAGESETVAGFIMFKTMDTSDETVQDFLDLLALPSDQTDADADNLFDNPAIYEIVDSGIGGPAVTDDFALLAMSHGTGLLTDSAFNAIPELDSDVQSWVTAFNYPFDVNANLLSTGGITIPSGLFREFNLAVPAGDQPTGDTSGTYYPVWISRIERIGTGSNQLRVYFATYNVTDTETGGSPSTTPIEFASLDLLRSYGDGDIVAITPLTDLLLQDSDEYQQHFGRGHVVLSSLWDRTTNEVDDFFDAFDDVLDDPADTDYTLSSTRISSFGLSRVPKYIPTIGQSRAMVGSTARRDTPIPPSDENRFVTELDQGLGNTVDLEAESGITPNDAIDRYGYTGSLCHKVIKLVVDGTAVDSNNATFYEDEILPRLRVLLGRDPQFGDWMYNGVRIMFFNGDTWQG